MDKRGVLFIIVIQGSRLMEKLPFGGATFSNTGFWGGHGKGRAPGEQSTTP